MATEVIGIPLEGTLWWRIRIGTTSTIKNGQTGHCNDTKFLNRQDWANSIDPDALTEQSDQGLHYI